MGEPAGVGMSGEKGPSPFVVPGRRRKTHQIYMRAPRGRRAVDIALKPAINQRAGHAATVNAVLQNDQLQQSPQLFSRHSSKWRNIIILFGPIRHLTPDT